MPTSDLRIVGVTPRQTTVSIQDPSWKCESEGCLDPVFVDGYIEGNQYRYYHDRIAKRTLYSGVWILTLHLLCIGPNPASSATKLASMTTTRKSRTSSSTDCSTNRSATDPPPRSAPWRRDPISGTSNSSTSAARAGASGILEC